MVGPNIELPAKTYAAPVSVVAEVNVTCGSVTSSSNEKAASERLAGPCWSPAAARPQWAAEAQVAAVAPPWGGVSGYTQPCLAARNRPRSARPGQRASPRRAACGDRQVRRPGGGGCVRIQANLIGTRKVE